MWVTPSDVIFLSLLNGGVNAAGLLLHGALCGAEPILDPGFCRL